MCYSYELEPRGINIHFLLNMRGEAVCFNINVNFLS